ncbi:hypothetical protein [Sciscionella marina]|uniref:hypothetical protein n=1 Tax=Sciscionella marina TaxID=508770 RepID=UPI00038115E2|nr:hypothetical protein [Sciscionella marina]
MDTDVTRAHTLFALGRGAFAQPLGAFGGFVTPDDVARFPIGRQLLASTTPDEVRDRFARFALAWDVAGFDTFARTFGNAAVPEATIHHADWVPHKNRCDIYAFDDGQWFHWISTDHSQWLRLTLADDGTVTEQPVARVYGADYARTKGLDLAPLAAWIMGAATTRLDRPDLVLSAYVDTGAATGEPVIHLVVHNGQPDELGVISAELESIAESCNWSNPCAPEDRRFDWCAPCVDLVDGMQPGEMVVVADRLDDE